MKGGKTGKGNWQHYANDTAISLCYNHMVKNGNQKVWQNFGRELAEQVQKIGSKMPLTRKNARFIIVLSKIISKRKTRNYTALAQVVENIGTPLP